MAIGHWVGELWLSVTELNQKITGSVVQSSCAKGVVRVLSFFLSEPVSYRRVGWAPS